MPLAVKERKISYAADFDGERLAALRSAFFIGG